MKKLKYLTDLDSPSTNSLKSEIRKWANAFYERAGKPTFTLKKCDFKNFDIFYFTDCTDILGKDPEGKGVETNPDIQKRKHAVYMYIFLKQFIGEPLPVKPSICTHCGEEENIDKLINGHMLFCKNCGKMKIVTYLDTAADDCMRAMRQAVAMARK